MLSMFTNAKVFLAMALFISTVFGSLQEVGKKFHSCSLPWQLAYAHDSEGIAMEGSKYSLVSAVLTGARVRVVIGTSYSAEVDSMFLLDDNVFAQLLQSVSKASWDTFQDDAYWWWIIVSTNGLRQMTRYNVGAHVHRGTNTDRISMKWYVKLTDILAHPSYSNLDNGDRLEGESCDIETSVRKGYEIRCVSNKARVSPLHNVAIENIGGQGVKFIVGQNVAEVSMSKSDDHYIFQSSAYWLFIISTTKGYRDSAGWSVGAHTLKYQNQDTAAFEWFADGCWEEVYYHNENGNAISGSLNALTSAVLSGHRVRVQFVSLHYKTVEPDMLFVRNGHVTAQILKQVSTSSLTRFKDSISWVWQIVSTTGTVHTTKYKIGEHKHVGDTTETQKLKWFVDSRPWVEVLSVNLDGKVRNGSKQALKDAVFNDGADVRCIWGDTENAIAYKPQNLALSPDGNDIAAQALNSVSVKYTSNNEYIIQPNAYWFFTIMSTNGKRDMSRWSVGAHVDRGHTTDKTEQKWFVNY